MNSTALSNFWPEPCDKCNGYRLIEGCDGVWRCVVCDEQVCRRRWAKTIKWLQAKKDIQDGKRVGRPRGRMG